MKKVQITCYTPPLFQKGDFVTKEITVNKYMKDTDSLRNVAVEIFKTLSRDDGGFYSLQEAGSDFSLEINLYAHQKANSVYRHKIQDKPKWQHIVFGGL